MAEASTFNCPKCGGGLTAASSAAEIKCPYCGNTVIVPEELRAPFLENEQALEMERAASTAGKFAVGVVGGTLALPIVIIVLTFCIIAATFFFVSQMLNQTFSSVAQFTQPTALSSFLTSIPNPTEAPRPTAAPRATATPRATSLPTPLPAATPTPYTKVLLKDDFSDTSSGWDRKNSSDYILDYVKGGYRIFIGKENGGQFVWTDKVFSNASVEADVKKIGGPEDAWFGVTCRMKEGTGGYAFKLSMDGSYEIDKYTFAASGDKLATLTDGTMSPDTLKTTDANHIRAACDHNTLSLFVNEQFVSQTSDGAFTSGGAGFVSLTGDSGQSGVDQLYSNFVVKGP
jgi:DNA-directed RNA polymerase subunit RPC12/RpoP